MYQLIIFLLLVSFHGRNATDIVLLCKPSSFIILFHMQLIKYWISAVDCFPPISIKARQKFSAVSPSSLPETMESSSGGGKVEVKK